MFAVVAFLAFSQFTITNASDVVAVCSMTGKITDVTNDDVYFMATGKSLQGFLNGYSSTDKCLPYNITYKFSRPLRTIFVKDQKVYIELDSITAMGPQGVVPTMDSWSIKSEVDAVRPFKIDINPERVDSNATDLKQVSKSESGLIEGQTYTVNKLIEILNNDETSTNLSVKTTGYVVDKLQCSPNTDVICPPSIYISSNGGTKTNSLMVPLNTYASKIKEFIVGKQYNFSLKIMRGRYEIYLESYTPVSLPKVPTTNSTSTLNVKSDQSTTTSIVDKSFADGWPNGGDIVGPVNRKFVWWNPFTWFGY